MKPNFTGYATKYGVLCSDGRTIVADAFKHQDKAKLPLMWRHDDDKNPENVLGHVTLEHMDGDGVRAFAYFNDTSNGKHARAAVEHGDIDQLSIKAVRLVQNGMSVTHGDLTEVSLVPHGANKEAKIDSVYLEHGDGYFHEVDNAGIIYTNIPLELTHEDEEDTSSDDDEEDTTTDDEGPSLVDIYNAMTDEQKTVVAVLVEQASEGAEQEDSEEESEEPIKHEEDTMTRNVFDQTNNNSTKNILSHEDQLKILTAAEKSKASSLADFILEHAGEYGITNIEDLFPEPKNVTDRPEWIKRDDSWVAAVLSGVTSRPFSRIKSMSADVTHEEARAKGYIKGDLKKEQYFDVAGRVTTPTTVYKKQKLDRDDILDVTDFDVVAWIKDEMRWMLQEELARAILFGDNRPVEDPNASGEPNPDKVREVNIRPIATDDDFYTAKVQIPSGTTAKSLAKTILRSRKLMKGGSGKPTLYTEDDLIVDMLLMEDKLGRRYYDTEASLAAALGVKNIVACEVLEEGYNNDEGDRLVGVLVNINDYTVGADKGGQVAMFDDFDIDYNQQKYLIETRRSGALTKHRSAVSLWESYGTEVVPTAPTRDDDTVTFPSITGVQYYYWTGTNDPVLASDPVLIDGETLHVEARPAEDYRFPFGTTTDWSFPA